MKTFAALTVAGVAAFALLKMLFALILPLVGLMLGMVVLVAKVALLVAVGFFVFSMIRKRCGRAAA
jgi:hypothetical protein